MKAFYFALPLLVLMTGLSASAQNNDPAPPSEPAPTALGTRPDDPMLRSRGSSFNPAISLNSLILYRNSNRGDTAVSVPRNGLSLQETELQFSADVDPYTRFVGILAVHPEEVDTDTTEEVEPAEYHLTPEELYFETLQIPYITLKGGKFRVAFGKQNQLHTHAWAFVDLPLPVAELLGDEGLNDIGVSASALLPTPWYMEFTAQALGGEAEGASDLFGSPSPNDVVGLARLRNLWDLSDDLTFEFGTSAVAGTNADHDQTSLFGADLTFKWLPVVGGRARTLAWSTELVARNVGEPDGTERGQGYSTYVQYQFTPRWWIQARNEYLEVKEADPAADPRTEIIRKNSALLGFFPTEFSGLRLQYDHIRDRDEKAEQVVSLQLNFSIGAHPAHAY